MKKILGFTFGAMQKRILNLVIFILAAMSILFALVATDQSRRIADAVSEAESEQQQAISQISEETMYQVQKASLVKTVSLEAGIAEADFSEVVNSLYMLQTMAQGVYENRDSLQSLEIGLPDPAKDGEASAYILCESGVDYTRSEYPGLMAHLADPMIAMHRSSDKIDGCYIGFEDGTDLCVDDKAAGKLDGDGNPIPFPVRERPWYTGAVEADGLYFTGIIEDMFSGNLLITCSIPVKSGDRLIGVAGIDVVMNGVSSFMSGAADGGGSVFIANSKGEIVLSSETDGLFAPTASASSTDNNAADSASSMKKAAGISGNREFEDLIDQSLLQTTDLVLITLGDRQYYMAGSPIPTLGCSVIMAVDKELTEEPERQMLASYNGINEEIAAGLEVSRKKGLRSAYILFALLFITGAMLALLAAKRVAGPIENITKTLVRCGNTGELFEMKDSFRTNDEIELLAECFANLSVKVRNYVEEITTITAEKERIGTELAMATQIQTAMLPHIVPAFPDRTDFDIIGSMNAAKEVGGDFYDYFLIDDDHLCMVIADVSGKGVPAALFMMASKIILQSVTMMGGSSSSPAQILRRTNEAICSNNEAEMFVTVWLGILELSTGRLTAANAGHEYPVVRQGGASFALLKDRHGFVLGGMDGVSYKDYELQMQPGDMLFVYTDGVPEATNEQKVLFGTDRMLGALNEEEITSPEQALTNVRSAVEAFVKDAEQFDDLTMLCVKYIGK